MAAVVGDIYHHVQLYLAARHDDGNDQRLPRHPRRTRRPMRCDTSTDGSEPSTRHQLPDAPGRALQPLARQAGFLDALSSSSPDGTRRGRIGVDFGSVSLCHVAAGFTDATVEFAKGFAIWDLAPGHYILHAAGGTTLTLDGEPLPLDHGPDHPRPTSRCAMAPRQTFIATVNPRLARQILSTLEKR